MNIWKYQFMGPDKLGPCFPPHPEWLRAFVLRQGCSDSAQLRWLCNHPYHEAAAYRGGLGVAVPLRLGR